MTGVGIAVKAREVAARDFQADAVVFQEDIARISEVDLVFIDFAGFQKSACFK